MSRPILRKEYRLSDLRNALDVHSTPNDSRSLHTLFAVLINDIDRRADIHQSIKPEIMEGLAQAWLYVAENEDGVDVLVEQERHGVSTSVEDPSDERAASSRATRADDESLFVESLRNAADGDISTAVFERDMRRLDDLRRKRGHPGLNAAESDEVEDLREKYGLEHCEWWQQQYLKQKAERSNGMNSSSTNATASH